MMFPVILIIGIHEVIFVSHAPPYIFKSSKPRYEILHILVSYRQSKRAEPPAVVWMENYYISFDSETVESDDRFLDVFEIFRVET